MLTIVVEGREFYDEISEQFVYEDGVTLKLEHSLVSISKWEQKWKKAFLNHQLNNEEFTDYIKCMTITQNVKDSIYNNLSIENLEDIVNYMNDSMTATTVHHRKKSTSREIITSEVIYHWMFSFNVPMECQKWHINRLITLLDLISVESQPKEKMSRKDTYAQNRRLNEIRRAKLKTKG